MKQCRGCQRFLGNATTVCPYCSHSESYPLSMYLMRNEELSNYEIYAGSFLIDGEEYKVIGIIGQGGHGIVLELEASSGNHYALKVPLIFNQCFTNNRGNRKSVLALSQKYILHEIEILNKIKSEALLAILYAGEVECRTGN